MTPSTRVAVETFWEYVAFTLNSMVFLLIGLEVDLNAFLTSWKVIVIAYLFVIAGRGLVIFAVSGLIRNTREKIPWSWSLVLTWGGLRHYNDEFSVTGLTSNPTISLPQACWLSPPSLLHQWFAPLCFSQQYCSSTFFSLIIADDVSQNALSTFIGAFIYSIVALVALMNGYYEKSRQVVKAHSRQSTCRFRKDFHCRDTRFDDFRAFNIVGENSNASKCYPNH